MAENNRKQLIGQVVESKMDKTAVVQIDRRGPHPIYKKYVTQSKKYYVHDEDNSHKNGDLVEIVSSKPLSKTKRWRVSRLTEKNEK